MKKILALITVLLLFGCLGKWGMNQSNETICVKSKFIDPPSEEGESSHYVIVSTAGDGYEVDRAFTNMFDKQANPDIIYGSIEVNHSYDITTTGMRVDVAYNYPLIQTINDNGECTG